MYGGCIYGESVLYVMYVGVIYIHEERVCTYGERVCGYVYIWRKSVRGASVCVCVFVCVCERERAICV